MDKLTKVHTTERTYVARSEEDGRILVLSRITTVLSTVRRLDLIPADVLAYAAARGKIVHYGTHLLDGGGGSALDWASVNDEIVPYLNAYERFKKETRAKILKTELFVASRKFRVGGTLDKLAVGIRDRRLPKADAWIVDVKTGVEDETHAWQTAAYELALKENTGARERFGRATLYLRPDATYRFVPCTAPDDLACFLACLTLYNRRQRGNP